MGYAFGALDQSQIDRVNAAANAAIASAARAQATAASMSSLWATISRTDSSYNAAQSDAHSAAVLRDAVVAHRDRILADPNASEADVASIEGSAPALSNAQLDATSVLLSPSTTFSQTFGPIPGQILGGIPWWAWAAGGLVALAVISPYINRKRR